MSLLQSIERLITVHPVIKSYFLNLENDECPELLLKFFTSHKSNDFGSKTYTYICINLPEVQNANLLLQREYTSGVSIHGIITTLLRKLKSRLQDDFFGYIKLLNYLKIVQ